MRTQNKGAGHNTSTFIALKHTYNKIQQQKPGTAQTYYGTNYRLYYFSCQCFFVYKRKKKRIKNVAL